MVGSHSPRRQKTSLSQSRPRERPGRSGAARAGGLAGRASSGQDAPYSGAVPVPGGSRSFTDDSLRRSDEDMELISALRDGDEDAFVILIERYQTPMLRLASMYVSKG